MAKSVKGMASAMAKPSMPIVGERILPWVDTATRRNPMIGPVQENDTRVRVNAMRKILRRPLVFSDFSSILLLHDDGRVISNAPKNDAANTTRRRQKKMLNMALVERALRALAPKSNVTTRPSTTYITTIEIPYVTASRMAFERSLLRLRKKLTVMGMIGHTQGVRRARNPPAKPARKM